MFGSTKHRLGAHGVRINPGIRHSRSHWAHAESLGLFVGYAVLWVLELCAPACRAVTVIEQSLLPGAPADRRELADSAVSPPTYIAPPGFGPAHWGQTLAQMPQIASALKLSFARLQTDSTHRQVFQNRCREASHARRSYACIEKEPPQARTAPEDQRYYISLAEYRLPDVSFVVPDSDAVFEEASYVMCAVYRGSAQVEHLTHRDANPRADLSLCGVRLKFRSTASVPGNAEVSDNELRVQRSLRRAFGAPAPPPPITAKRLKRAAKLLTHEVWCPMAKGNDADFDCLAQLVYVYDLRTHNGFVFLATPAVYAYTFSRLQDYQDSGVLHQADFYYLFLLADPPLRYNKMTTYISPEREPSMMLGESVRAAFEVRESPP